MSVINLEDSCYYHIYNRGNNKQNIFFEEGNYTYFIELLKKYLLPIVDIYSYCLLPNHFHIFIRVKDKNEILKNVKQIKTHLPFSNFFNAYAKAINKKHQRTGSLFQKRFKRILIKDEEYLKNLIIYVNTNPFHHQIFDYKEYNHSSYKALISTSKTQIMRNEVMELFEDVDNFKYVLEFKKEKLEQLNVEF